MGEKFYQKMLQFICVRNNRGENLEVFPKLRQISIIVTRKAQRYCSRPYLEPSSVKQGWISLT